MLIQFTPAELDEAARIKEHYHEERTAIDEEISRTKDEEQRASLLVKRQRSVDAVIAELDALSDRIQRERFAPIRTKGAGAILDHAREQAPAILEQLHKQTARSYSDEYKGERHFLDEMIKGLGIGTVKDGKLYLSANYAMDELKSELRLHTEALQGNEEAADELLAILVETIENSDLTDSEEVADVQEVPAHIRRYRRTPLNDIKKFGLMNDKIMGHISQDSDDIFTQRPDGQMVLRWAVNQTPQKKEAVPVYIGLTYEGKDEGFKVSKSMSDYDKRICEAIGTRFFYWRQDNPNKPLYITPQEIWRTMNGKSSRDGKAKPSEKQISKICSRMDRMRFTRVNMDISAEIEAFHLSIDDERITGGLIETYFLNSNKETFTTEKGNVVKGYRINEEPILYTYNKIKNHLLYVPYEVLDTSYYVRDSENVTEFRGYLVQQIQLMINATNNAAKDSGKRFKRNDKILLESIYKSTGILPPEERVEKGYANEATRQQIIRRNRQTDRQKIEGLLDAWTAKGWIKGYTVLNSKGKPLEEKQQAAGYKIRI